MLNEVIKILLIEDDLDDILLIQETVFISNKNSGNKIRLEVSDTLEEGYEKLLQKHYDLLLLDLNLGLTTGLETLLAVKKWGFKLPIIVLTDLAEEQLGLECIRNGASDYLIKKKVDSSQMVSNILVRSVNYAIERNKLTQEIIHQKVELERSYGELSQLTFSSSHDLKEPLRGIIRYSQMFQQQYYELVDEEGRSTLDFIVSEAKRQNTQINGLLKYLAIDIKREKIEVVNLNQLIDSILKRLQYFLSNTNMNLKVGELPTVFGQERYLREVFINLFSNAVKFRDLNRKLEINITAEEKEQDWLIRFSDNGTGFESEYAKQVFQIFKTLTPKHQNDGAGVGLPIIKKIIAQMGGEVWAESTLGKGTTFLFTLKKRQETFHR